MTAASMSKENIFSTVRALFIVLGTFLVGHGHNIFGQPLDAQSWETITGAVVALGMAIWGVISKDTPIEGIESFLRSFVQGIGGLLVGAGILTGATLDSILGLLAAVIPLLQSFASKTKAAQITSGQITPLISATTGQPTGMMTKEVEPKPDTNVVVDPAPQGPVKQPDPAKPPDQPSKFWKGKP